MRAAVVREWGEGVRGALGQIDQAGQESGGALQGSLASVGTRTVSCNTQVHQSLRKHFHSGPPVLTMGSSPPGTGSLLRCGAVVKAWAQEPYI